MASTLPIIDPCCVTPCTATTTIQVPGPAGADGADGADGAPGVAGKNGYTSLAANYTMPAELATGQATVVDTAWMAPDQIVYITGLGYFIVDTIDSSTLVTLRNLEDTANQAYLTNAPPGTIAPSGSRVTAGGRQGPPGLFSQIYIDRHTLALPPDDPTEPALSYPTGGGNLAQWDVATQLWI